MGIQRVAIVATAALLGSLALSACSGSGSGASGSTNAGGPASVSASASTPASAPASGSTGTGTGSTPGAVPTTNAPSAAPTGGSGSGSGSGGSGSAPQAAGLDACTTAQLAFGIGPDSGPQSVGDTTAAEVVKLTNTGSASCAMHGFPGVDLKTNAGTLSVPRSKQVAELVTLKPGASALFNINYTVNNTGGSGVRVDTMVITPPNETHSHTLAWNQGTLPVTDGSGSSITVDPVVAFSG